MLSMKEIAQKAGVSVATVSRVFNENPHVSPEAREKVLRCLEENGYQMNEQARSLRTRRTNNIIALVPSMKNPMFSSLVASVCEEARKRGWNILIASIENEVSNVAPYIKMLEAKQAEGIIFASKSFDKMTMEKVMGRFPFVTCNEMYPDPRCPFVAIDNEKASRKATSYLLDSGCRNIGYIAGHTTSPSTYLRLKGYRETLSERGLEYSEGNVLYGSVDGEDVMPRLASFIRDRAIDGLLVNSDVQSALAVKCMIEHMGKSAKDIHLVSFDGSYMTRIFVPSITSIIQPMEEIGRMAVDNLIAQIEKKEYARETLVPFSFEIRNT